MPRSKKTNGKRGNRRSAPKGDTTEAPSDLAKYAIDVIKKTDKVIRFFNTEEKMFDVVNTQSVSNTGSVIALSAVRQGTAWNNRIGNSLRLLQFEFRANLTINTAATASYVRALIVADMNNIGSTPGLTDVLETGDVKSPYNHSYLQRFAVIYDDMIPLTKGGNDANTFSIREPLNNHIYFEGDSGTSSMLRQNQLFLLLIGTESVNTPTYSYYSRISFVDD